MKSAHIPEAARVLICVEYCNNGVIQYIKNNDCNYKFNQLVHHCNNAKSHKRLRAPWATAG